MPCRVCRPSVAKVSTPSAVLPSSSTLTLDKPIVPPITLACALMAKWPKPPPGSGFCPTQVSALRSDAASAASVPSILRVGLTLIAPSKAALIGLPAIRSFTPVRLPASAAGKSPSVSVTSSGSSCQTKRPLAPKLLEIDGHASEKAASLSVSSILFCLLRTNTVPFSMRISENAARRGKSLLLLRASASIRPDQLDVPFGSKSIAMVGRSSATSEISTRPSSSGKKRNRAVSRSAVSAGRFSSPSTTSAKLTLPVGNSETLASPRRIGSKPVTARISLKTCPRTAPAEIR